MDICRTDGQSSQDRAGTTQPEVRRARRSRSVIAATVVVLIVGIAAWLLVPPERRPAYPIRPGEVFDRFGPLLKEKVRPGTGCSRSSARSSDPSRVAERLGGLADGLNRSDPRLGIL